jgi:hypothetical protein
MQRLAVLKLVHMVHIRVVPVMCGGRRIMVIMSVLRHNGVLRWHMIIGWLAIGLIGVVVYMVVIRVALAMYGG